MQHALSYYPIWKYNYKALKKHPHIKQLKIIYSREYFRLFFARVCWKFIIHLGHNDKETWDFENSLKENHSKFNRD
jgi:hypothetical protein